MLLLQTVIVEILTGYHDIDCKFVFVLFNRSSREFILVVHKRNHSICYTITIYEVRFFKNGNQWKPLRDIFVYNFLLYICFICRCKFVIIETHAYVIAHEKGWCTVTFTLVISFKFIMADFRSLEFTNKGCSTGKLIHTNLCFFLFKQDKVRLFLFQQRKLLWD